MLHTEATTTLAKVSSGMGGVEGKVVRFDGRGRKGAPGELVGFTNSNTLALHLSKDVSREILKGEGG
jgi:hypothetical protein